MIVMSTRLLVGCLLVLFVTTATATALPTTTTTPQTTTEGRVFSFIYLLFVTSACNQAFLIHNLFFFTTIDTLNLVLGKIGRYVVDD